MKIVSYHRCEKTGNLTTIFKKDNGCCLTLSLKGRKIELEGEYSSLMNGCLSAKNRQEAASKYHTFKNVLEQKRG